MIFFDIDGTLVNHAAASAAASLIFFDHFAGQVPCSRHDFPVFWEQSLNKHFNRFCRGEISLWQQRRERMREVFSRPELTDEEADSRYQVFIREYESLTRAFDDVAPCLHRLGEKRLGIISNGAREQQIGKLRRAGLLNYFSVLVFSEDLGVGKPSPNMFLEACRLGGEAPSACTHIGDDTIADIAPSHALGMRAIWLDRSGNGLPPVPVAHISTLQDLESALSREARPQLAKA